MVFLIFLPVFLSFLAGIFILYRVTPISKERKEEGNIDDLSVVIPAYNEEERIKPLLDSLKSQKMKPGEIIVVDDHSTDKTGETARAFGVKVIRSAKTDDSWVGKARALWTGANAACGKYLLFLDADTKLSSEYSLYYIFSEYKKRGNKGIMSIQPYHRTKRFYESFSLIFNIVVLSGMSAFTPLGDRMKPLGAFGPCMLTKKKDYITTGGHSAIKGKVLDDIALGKLFMEKGMPSYCYGGKGIIDFRMYPEGFKSLVEGWSKNFGEAASSCNISVLLAVIIWITGGFYASGIFIGSIVTWEINFIIFSIILYIIYMIQMYHMAIKTGKFSILCFPLFFLHHIFFTLVFFISLVRIKIFKKVSWRGRKIKL